jgi:FKBP-type peptidyl-prolyl cis-trans isomerase
MRKPLIVLGTFLAAGVMLMGSTQAQTPTSSPTPTPAKKPATATKSTSSTGTKTGTPVAKPGAVTTLTTDKQKSSYAIGMNWGTGLRHQSIDVDTPALLQGMKDALAGGKTLMTEEEASAALKKLQGEMQAKQQAKAKEEEASNKTAGAAFLAANKSKPGVVTLPSGLQYKILTPGTGPKPSATDTVVCNYRGTLVNGTEFDSSFKRGEPATFPVSGVIKGWTEALQLMAVGSKWQLFIPPDMAYGERGTPGGPIGPNSTLIFEVELISIKDRVAPVPPPTATPSPAAAPSPDAAPKQDKK